MTSTQPGVVLAGRYLLERELGDSLPQVEHWRARDQVLDRAVELYVLLEGETEAALDAARRAALVSDPRLARVLDVGQDDGVAYVVTEKVGGRSLAEIVAAGPLPADQARAVVGELAVALETARRRGVHHLALRPSAVYVEPSGAVLLTGLAVEGALLGLDQADARTTTRADAVALVQLLYAALTGRWPGAASGDALALPPAPATEGVTVPPGELAPDVPNDLDTLCAVTFGPHEDGPHSPAELAADLEPWPPVRGAALLAAAGLTDDDVAPVPPSVPPAGGAVRRQSVRERAAGPASVPPGTPPPARPSSTRPPVVPPPGATPVAPAGAPAASGPTPPASLVGGTYVPASTSEVPRLPFEQVAAPQEPARTKHRTFNATPFVLVLVLAALGFGAVLAYRSLLAPSVPAVAGPSPSAPVPTTEDPETEDPETETTDPEATETEEIPPPRIASGLQLDPDGDGDEHPEAVDRAYDGDMDTAWYTRWYNNPEMPGKSGLGYEITLEEETLVSGVTLYIDGEGGHVEVRSTTGDAPTDGEVLASGSMSPETVLFFDEPVRTGNLVLWFTELPVTAEGDNRVMLYEIELD